MATTLETLRVPLILDDSQFQAGLRSVGASLAAIGAPFAIATKASFDLAANLEQNKIAFETMLGSGKAATEMLGDLSDFARKTPFELVPIRDTAKQLLGMGIEADKLIPTLKSLGDVSSGLNVDIKRMALNFGQVKAQGRLTGRELRDFAVMGVPLIQELANMFEKTTAEIKNMVSAGEIGFADVEQAFNNMSSAGGRFADLMDKQSTTVAGRISNLKDNITRLGESIGQFLLPIVGVLTTLVGFLVEALNSANPIIKLMITLVLVLGASLVPLGAALFALPFAVNAVNAAFGLLGITTWSQLIPALQALTVTIAGVEIALLPLIGIVLALVAAAGVLFFQIKNVVEGFKQFFNIISKALAPEIQELRQAWAELTGQGTELGNVLRELGGQILPLVVAFFRALLTPVILTLKVITTLIQIVNGLKNAFNNLITGRVINFIQDIINKVKELIRWLKNIPTNIAISIRAAIGLGGGSQQSSSPSLGQRIASSLPFIGAFTKRQHGGTVMGGQSYTVGEKGIEKFTPRDSGEITSNSNLEGLDYDRLARTFGLELERRLNN